MRRPTVFDYANLQLHPDGSRAGPSDSGRHFTDTRGNVIARDAVGAARIIKRRRLKSPEGVEERGSGNESEGSPPERSEEDRVPFRFKDYRALQRQTFEESKYDLMPPPSSHLLNKNSTFPEPSSDLINTIHHLASVHWNECGQLSNQSRVFRRRKKARLIEKANPGQNDEDSPQGTPERSTRPTRSLSPSHYSPSKSGSPERTSQTATSKKQVPSERKVDMYLALDGSAISAIGMLVQEYIAHSMSGSSPNLPRSEGILSEKAEAQETGRRKKLKSGAIRYTSPSSVLRREQRRRKARMSADGGSDGGNG